MKQHALLLGSAVLVLASLHVTAHSHQNVLAATLNTDLVGVVNANEDPAALKRLGTTWYLNYNWLSTIPSGLHRVTEFGANLPDQYRQPLRQYIVAHPGQTWLIGSEPNISTFEHATVEEFVTIWHDMVVLVRTADPTATIVGPNVLNWVDTCVSCEGFQSGADWTQAWYTDYLAKYGVRPDIDIWSLHTYELNWVNMPNLHADFHIRQMTAMRTWLDSIPAESGRPIWNTEIGFHWAYSGYVLDPQQKVVPTGNYDTEGARVWFSTILNWLKTDGVALNIRRSFFFAQSAQTEAFATVSGGLGFLRGTTADAPLTPFGEQLTDFYRDAAPSSAAPVLTPSPEPSVDTVGQ